MNTQRSELDKKALIEIFVGILLLGTGPMFVKTIQANGILVAFYRMFFASILLLIPAQRFKRKNTSETSDKSGFIWVLLGGSAFAVNIALWTSALNFTSAAVVTLLDNTAPVWVGLFSLLVLKHKQNRLYWAGLGLAIAGSYLLVAESFGGQDGQELIGNLLSIASGMSYAVYILVTRQARKKESSIRYSWLVSLIGAGLLFLAGLLTGVFTAALPLRSYILIFLMSVSSQVFGWYLVNDALGKLPAAAASVALVGQPLVTTILGVFILGEVPSIIQILGGAVCLFGIMTVQRSFRNRTSG